MSAITYPVHVDAQLDAKVSRWLWLLKWLLSLPHFIVLAFLWVAFAVLSVVAFFAILFTGHYPRRIFEFNVGVLRWQWRVSYYAYGALATDRYPPFTLHEVADYPAHLEVDYPERLSRGLVLVKWWLLAIPHYLIVSLLVGGAGQLILSSDDRGRLVLTGLIPLLALVAGVVLLLTGRYPQSVFDLLLGLNRWVLRVAGYAALMTDTYPPFRLDQGGHEGEAGTVVATPAAPPQGTPSPVAETPQPPTPSHWTTGRIVSLVVGCVLAVVTLGLAIPGFALLVADQTARDDDGYLMSPELTVQTSTYAIASGEQQLQVGAPTDITPAALLGDTKLTATATDATAVFVGIGPAADVEAYLAGVQHADLIDVEDGGDAVYRSSPGGPPSSPPQDGDFWVAKAFGPGTQEVTWTPTNGDWAVLVMNDDASRGVDVTVTAGAEIPSLPWVIAIWLSLAGVGLVLAALLIVAPLRTASRQGAESR